MMYVVVKEVGKFKYYRNVTAVKWEGLINNASYLTLYDAKKQIEFLILRDPFHIYSIVKC